MKNISKILASICLSSFAVPSMAQDVFEYKMDFTNGDDNGFVGLLRDVPKEQFDNYMELAEMVRNGANPDILGPVAPETKRNLGTDWEGSHWFMNAGVYTIPDVPGEITGYMLQGVNRSDDMDKYMVKSFGEEDGLKPNTKYEVLITKLRYSANDAGGAFGAGGSPARSFEGYVVNKSPFDYEIDDQEHVRFTANNRLPFMGKQVTPLGYTGVCIPRGGFTTPGIEICPRGGIKYRIIEKISKDRAMEITTDSEGTFWLLIGGHSGHESLDEYYIIDFDLTIKEL